MRRLYALLPAIAVLLAYLPILTGEPVWDDHTLLQPAVLEAAWGPLPFNPDYFRPLGVWTLKLGASASDPMMAHHLINVLLHALNTVLIFVLIRQRTTSKQDWAPLSLSLLYGLHPALVEGVAFIASRFDLLLTGALLLVLVADRGLKGVARPLAVGVAFMLAALSKEMAAAFPLALLFWHRADHDSFAAVLKERWSTYAAVVLSGLVYLGLRYQALGGLMSSDRAMIDAGSPVSHLLLIAQSIGGYLGLAVFPMGHLTPIHHIVLPIEPSSNTIGVAIAVAGLLVALPRFGPTGWRLLAGVVAMLPVINILPLDLTGGAYIAERFLVFPAALLVAGTAVFLAGRLDWRRRPVLVIGVVLWSGAALAGVRDTLPHWHTERALWQWGLTAAPKSPLPRINLARLLTDGGDPRSGLALSDEAIALEATSALAWNNRGQALFHLGELPAAAESFTKAGTLEPDNAMFHANLGGTLLELGELERARTVLVDQALFWDANNVEARINLAGVYIQSGRPDLARPLIDGLDSTLPPDRIASMREDTMNHATWLALGDHLRSQGDLEGAMAALSEAARLGAAPIDLAISRSSVLIEAGQLSEAVKILGEMLPGSDPRVPFNLGIIAERAGQPTEAVRWYSEAAARDPQWVMPRQKLAELPPAVPKR
ncbi:MAG: tetratricopeptide (TPR) repeat protein [Myxococcota bacterium]|jgi:tetratricopeptide (TPR) repeat protein